MVVRLRLGAPWQHHGETGPFAQLAVDRNTAPHRDTHIPDHPQPDPEAAAALELLGCEVTVVPTRHPVVDIVPFQLLTLDLAEARGIDPDLIRWDDPRWKAARDAYA